jgi:nucleotide-binding universal stress UspA family protein
MFQPRHILVPTDFSDHSNYALQVAIDLARQHGATLTLLHVAETLGPEYLTYGEAVSQLQPDSYRQRLMDELRRTLLPPAAGVPVEYLLAEGEPAVEIGRAARDHSCDLIVLGSHGRTGVRRLLMGSVAEHVVRYAACPVLTVKKP